MGKPPYDRIPFFIITVWLIYSLFHVSRQGKHLYEKLYCVNAERNTSAFYNRLFSTVPSMASFSVNVCSETVS